jgi:hypothetical protein
VHRLAACGPLRTAASLFCALPTSPMHVPIFAKSSPKKPIIKNRNAVWMTHQRTMAALSLMVRVILSIGVLVTSGRFNNMEPAMKLSARRYRSVSAIDPLCYACNVTMI